MCDRSGWRRRFEIGIAIPRPRGHGCEHLLLQLARKIEWRFVLIELDLRLAQLERVSGHRRDDAAAHARLLCASDFACSGRPSNSARRCAYGAIRPSASSLIVMTLVRLTKS